MSDRRPLTDGLKPAPAIDPAREKEFVFGPKAAEKPKEATAPAAVPPPRLSFHTRLRADYLAALKRASLERQLAGVRPHTVQEFLEEALEPWLKANGYRP